MKNLLSKNQIKNIRAKFADDAGIKLLTRMAESHRQYAREKAKRLRRRPKKYLKSTDYLTTEQFARILYTLSTRAERDRKRTSIATRNIQNEMMVILMAETGLRAGEIINLKLRDLPGVHEKTEIEVREGKGRKDRTVGISDFLTQKLIAYCAKYHKGHGPEAWLLNSERGGQMKYYSIYSKIKTIGRICGIWLIGDKSKLKPHNFRHTFATILLDETDNEFLVQSQLGHEKTDTTKIYTRTLNQKMRSAMNGFHNRLYLAYNGELFKNL